MKDLWDRAIDFAERRLREDADWQEVQFDLINNDEWAELFDLDECPEGADMDTMMIIRTAEERLAEDA